MKKAIKVFGTELGEQARQSYEIWAPFAKYYALISISIPLVGLYEVYVLETCLNTIYLRTSMAVPGLLFYWLLPYSPSFERRAHLVWALCLAYVLPFGFGFILVHVAACTPDDAQVPEYLVVQYLCALFLLIQVSGSIQLTLALWLLSTTLSIGTTAFYTSANWPEIERVSLYYGIVYVTILIAGSLANQTNRMMEQARAQVGQMIGANIAHELRTPLASIRAVANGSLKLLSNLVDGYRIAVSNQHISPKLSPPQEKGVEDALGLIRSEVDYSNLLIDILLINTSIQSTAEHESIRQNASIYVQDAIHRFPYANKKERNIISIEVHRDFSIEAPPVLLTHVILNVLKNAVYYSQKNKTPSVKVCIGQEQTNAPILTVADNGPGIKRHEMRYIFNRYYTTTSAGEGAGVGLSFCRTVMNGIGGSIECSSKHGMGSEFRLTFPTV